MYPNNYNDSYLNNLIDQLKNNSRLEEEIESGILEYKLRLDKCDANSLKKLESQMLWRINEGKLLHNTFRAYYVIGIQDDGQLGYMKTEIINNSIKN
jgi:GTPase